MAPIRKGDGTGLAGEGYSQVRKGDGTILWNAIPDSVVDNFESSEDEPIGPYESNMSISDFYREDTSSYTRTQSGSAEGDFELAADSASEDDFIVSLPGDGLPRYPQNGETAAFLLSNPADPHASFLYSISDNSGSYDGYAANISSGGDALRLWTFVNGSHDELILNVDTTISADVWYWVEVDIPTSDDPTHELRIYDVDTSTDPPTRGEIKTSGTETDDRYLDGEGVGAAIRQNGGSGNILDYVHVID